MRKNLKMLFFFLVFVFVSLTFNNVFANTETKDELEEKRQLAQKMVEILPESIELDMTEEDVAKKIFEENSDNISLCNEKIKEIWKNSGFDVDELNINFWTKIGYQSVKGFHTLTVHNEFGGQTDINLIYKNQSDYNIKDETYVKNLNINNPEYCEISFDEWIDINKDGDWGDGYIAIFNRYFENIIKDKSVTVQHILGGFGSDNFSFNEGVDGTLMIFKNGILYDCRTNLEVTTFPVINVPYEISDDNISEYILKLIKSTFSKEFNTGMAEKFTIEEKKDNLYFEQKNPNIRNAYTIYDNVDGKKQIKGYVIARKQEGVTSTDEKTNVQFSASNDVVPNNTVLDVKEVSDETTLNQIRVSLQNTSTKYVTYDITLKSNNVAIQPNGKVQISIPIPSNFDKNNLAVYRIEPNGNKIAYEITVKTIDGQDYAIFETDHFSNYVLAEKTLDETGSKEEQNKQHILDDEPKTGTTSNVGLIAIMVVITMNIIFLYKKYK